jgi:hypothetical protein
MERTGVSICLTGTHDNVWKKRGTLATKINNVLREIETDVAAVIEGDEDVPSAEPYAHLTNSCFLLSMGGLHRPEI